MPFPNSYGGGKKSNLNAFPRSKKRKDNPKATPNQKRTRSANTVDTGPTNPALKRIFGGMK